MKEMVFDSQQKAVTVTHPEQGITDVLILTDEKTQKRKDEMSDDEKTEYCYNGNSVRLYKEITEDEATENMGTLLEQEQTDKPTDEMQEYANAKIDEFTLQLMEEGCCNMRILVESFKRLYEKGKITKEALQERVTDGKITQEEFDYIIGEKNE